MTAVSVRYFTDDVDAAVDFYVERLGFNVEMRPGAGFVVLSRSNLRLLLNEPGAGGAGQPMPDGRHPEPGGWNRIRIEVSNLELEVEALREGGANFRNEIVTGRGGSQILLEDPSGNPIGAVPARRRLRPVIATRNPRGAQTRCHPSRTSPPTSCCAARRPVATCP